METKKSEFGAGFAYSLGLFLGHEAQIEKFLINEKMIKEKNPEYKGVSPYALWMYGAADHLFELDPGRLPLALATRANKFKSRCLKLRMVMSVDCEATKKDYEWAIKEAKELLMEVDRKLGIEPIKGDYE